MVKSKASKRSQKSARSNASQCDEIVQCPHIHFKSDVIDRNVLSKEQHLNLLSTPKGYRWEEAADKKEGGQGENTENLPTHISRRVVCTGRRMRRPEKVYVHNFLAEVWSFLTPEMVDRLKGMLMNEFGMSPQEADQLVNEQRESNIVKSSSVSFYKKPRKLKDGSVVYDSVVKLRSPNKSYCDKYPKSSIGIRNSWIRNFSDMLSEKLSSYVLETMCAERSERQQEIAQTLLTRFNTILEQKASMTNPRTKTHKAMVLVADKLSLWLDKNVKLSKETAQRLKELEEQEEIKRINDEKKKKDEEKRKLEEEKKRLEEEKKRLEEEKKKKEEDEKKRLEEEKQKKEDEEKQKKEDEEKQKKEDEEKQKKEDEEKQKKEDEEKQKKEDEERIAAEEAQKEQAPGEQAEGTTQEEAKLEDGEAEQLDTTDQPPAESDEPPKTEEGESEKPPSEAQPTEGGETQPESAEPSPETDEQKPETDGTEEKMEPEQTDEPKTQEPEGPGEEKSPDSSDQPEPGTEEGKPPESEEAGRAEDTEPKGESEEAGEKVDPDQPLPDSIEPPKTEGEDSENPQEEPSPPTITEEPEKSPDSEREPSTPGSPKPGETPDETPAVTPSETPDESGAETGDETVPLTEEEKEPGEKEPEEKEPAGEKEGMGGETAMITFEPGETAAEVDSSKLQEVIESVASIIMGQEQSPTPRQEAIKDVVEKELEKTLGDEDMKGIDEVAGKVGTWMDKVIDKVEEEYADKGSGLPPVSQKPKGPVFKLRKMDDAFDVELISNTKAEKQIREARGKQVSPYKTADTSTPLEPEDLKEWAKWATAVTDMAQNWAEWIEETVKEAEKKGDEYKKVEDGENMKDWEKFKDKKSSDAVEWRRTKKQVDQQAEAWTKKSEKDKQANQQMEKDKGIVNLKN